jgi:pyruvate kinase
MRTTKIICTLGPASDKVATVRAMVRAGMDVARLNFSHGTYEHHLHLLKTVRHVGTELKKPIVVMQDLQGPKIRVGKLPKPLFKSLRILVFLLP